MQTSLSQRLRQTLLHSMTHKKTHKRRINKSWVGGPNGFSKLIYTSWEIRVQWWHFNHNNFTWKGQLFLYEYFQNVFFLHRPKARWTLANGSNEDPWSQTIACTHGMLCGIFATCAPAVTLHHPRLTCSNNQEGHLDWHTWKNGGE